jgi:hypothetical protein
MERIVLSLFFFLDAGWGFGYNSRAIAGVVKLVDARDSKSRAREGMPVRPRPPAPRKLDKGFCLIVIIGRKPFSIMRLLSPTRLRGGGLELKDLIDESNQLVAKMTSSLPP